VAEGVTAHVTQAVAFGECQLAGALPSPLLEVGDIEMAAGGTGEHASVGRDAAELFEVGAQHGRLSRLEVRASATEVAVGFSVGSAAMTVSSLGRPSSSRCQPLAGNPTALSRLTN
jgi:hypothetical protein